MKHFGLDRHSGTGKSPHPKKGGKGGKGVWGDPLTDDLQGEEDAKREAELNEEGEEEVSQAEPGAAVEPAASSPEGKHVDDPNCAIIREFLRSGDFDDFEKNIEDQGSELNAVALVRKAIQISMEYNDYERELVSRMFAVAYGKKLLYPEKLESGFQRALDAVADDLLDIPEAVSYLAKFIARAMADEVLPISFPDCAELRTPEAAQAVALARGMINAPHFGRRLGHIWGPGDQASVKRLLEEVNLIIDEYINNSDAEEAGKSIKRLNARSFHFHIVEEGLKKIMEEELNVEVKNKIFQFFKELRKNAILSPGQIKQGFDVTHQSIDDIKLDVPHAPKLFESLQKEAIELGLFTTETK